MWGYDEMPMIRHDAVRKNGHLDPLDCFFNQILEGEVVARMLKKHRPFRRSIQDVEHEAGSAVSPSPRHSEV